ncbi:phage holin family protein [uncultured Dokdonia sp.]|uniref:phage holin family protein n=1 Tax=uncultured Dokdonia sp. TaxID=575653 RepID=UPI0026144E40|nr:phage holin family protein [uncultured Dokdonia sp.]
METEKITKILFWLCAILAPVQGMIVTMIFLIIVDFITGSYASFKNGVAICCYRIMHTISKFFIYNLVILAAYFMEMHILQEIPLLKIIAGFIAIAEIKSILENFSKIYGVNPLKAFTNLLRNTAFKDSIEQLRDKPSKKKKKEV